jgi:hypothetical protein
VRQSAVRKCRRLRDQEEEEEEKEEEILRGDAESVSRSLLALVEERTGDVSDAGSEPDESGNNHLLGLAACI